MQLVALSEERGEGDDLCLELVANHESGLRTTGCLAVCVISNTPLIFYKYGNIGISFYVLNEHSLGFDFLKKKIFRENIFLWVCLS